MSESIYGFGFIIIYEALITCNKAFKGSRIDLPPNLFLFQCIYIMSIFVMFSVVLLGFFYFAWWLPIAMFFALGPLISIVILRWFRFGGPVIRPMIFLILGSGIAFCTPFVG